MTEEHMSYDEAEQMARQAMEHPEPPPPPTPDPDDDQDDDDDKAPASLTPSINKALHNVMTAIRTNNVYRNNLRNRLTVIENRRNGPLAKLLEAIEKSI